MSPKHSVPASVASTTAKRRWLKVLFPAALFLMVSGFANAQCSAYGADTTCGAIITIVIPSAGGAAQATVSFTGQGPYDGADDTLVGVINNTSLPISSLTLTSNNGAFGFDGDGINTYGAPGNGMDVTRYGGPNTYFTKVTATSAVANFITPLSPNGGTTYFSLENSLGAATLCSAIIDNTVPKPAGGGTSISTIFTPNYGYTLAQAAQACGFTQWDWQQTITALPLPSPFFDNGAPTVALHAPPPFNDPPPNDYTYSVPPSPAPLPLYYSPFSGLSDPYSVVSNTTPTTLNYFDAPADPCLAGGSGSPCGGRTALPGKVFAFTTHLVGLAGSGPGYTIQDTGIGFSWYTTYNGTSGGISVTRVNHGVDPGSGTGAVSITAFNGITTYLFPKSVGVSAVNGNPVGSSVSGTNLLGAGQAEAVASGLAYSRSTQTYVGTVTITNVSNSAITGPFQIVFDSLNSGVTVANATSTFGGWPYLTVTGTGSLQPGQSASVSVQFRNPANTAISFSPVPYSGNFN